MDAREQRGLAIAALNKIIRKGGISEPADASRAL